MTWYRIGRLVTKERRFANRMANVGDHVDVLVERWGDEVSARWQLTAEGWRRAEIPPAA